MDKFNFKLQKILDLRISSEETSKESFANAQRKLAKEETILNELINVRKTAIDKNMSFKSSFDYLNFTRYIDNMDSKINLQNQSVINAKSELEKKKFELIKATEDRKVMEKLRDKAKEEFNFIVKQTEQKQNDDFALFSFIRNERR